jgi:hypothetical protein
MTKSDLKYYVEEIQAHKFYTQLNKKGEKLYLFEIGDREDGKITKMRVCVIDVTGAQVYYTDWYRSYDQLDHLLESLNLDANDLVEVDNIVSVVEDGST